MHNIELRDKIKKAGFFNYEIAAKLGISEYYFSRMISRSELSEEKKEWILTALRELFTERINNI